MSTLAALWLDLTHPTAALLVRCHLLRLRRRLRAYDEVLYVFEGLLLAIAEHALARSLLSALWALWRRVDLTDSNGMVMGLLMLMGWEQTLVVDDIRWSTGASRLPTPAHGAEHPSLKEDVTVGSMDVDGDTLQQTERGLRQDTVFAESEEMLVTFHGHLPAEVKHVLKNVGERSPYFPSWSNFS
jgi:hypothetical protein